MSALSESPASGNRPPASRTKSAGFLERVILYAMMMSLAALAIDAMLPALSIIGTDLQLEDPNDAQYIIVSLFFGMATGQIFSGPWSDSVGRRPVVLLGFSLFSIGSLISMLSTTMESMLLGRFLQGLGAAGPRTMTVSLIRDQFSGAHMAKLMSFTMTVFILVPAVAPALGQFLMQTGSWHTIFAAFIVLSMLAASWFFIRQPETLAPEHKRTFSVQRSWQALKEICLTPTALGYTIVSGLVFGGFLGYLISAQQIFQLQYNLGAQFPLYFAALALAIGLATFVNGRVVVRVGMHRLITLANAAMVMITLIFLICAWQQEGQPPLWLLMAWLVPLLFGFGILFGNLNAMAMEPLGHMAGVGASVVATLSTLISLPIGTLIGQSYSDSVLPLTLGFFLTTGLALVLVIRLENRRRRIDSDQRLAQQE